MRLTDKVIFITGASRGIGAASARQLAQRGARLVLGARTAAPLQAVADDIRDAGGEALAVPLDVTDPASVQAAVDVALARYGRIDVLINNAGNGGALGFLLDTDPDATRAMFEVHVFGAERMTRAVLPAMLAQGGGRVVNVVSTVGYVPMPGAAAYCAAKAAVIALTEALRGELADHPVTLVLFSPPHTQTEAGRDWPLDLPRTFQPDEAAAALVATLQRDRRDWLAGGNQTLLWLQRISPRWAAGIMRGIGLDATRKALALKAPALAPPGT
ncbi:MAG: SDR family oxidoreductase [Alphaproteobacteria bacterium]|nr:SDR family oxidoreductase [Alphaproteobacteria bacterium]